MPREPGNIGAPVALPDYRVRARNTAADSLNKIHDDDVARIYGFRGGLVPGVDVYAYITHPVVELWGLAWLERGTIDARFVSPVYDGDETVVTVREQDETLDLIVHDGSGTECARARATLPHIPDPPPELAAYPAARLPETRPIASPASLRSAEPLGTLDVGFRSDRAAEYLAEVQETLSLYHAEGVAHPGWLLRQANFVLVANVALGPWIHASSAVRNFGALRDGERVEVRGHVRDVYERKGHEFVDLDLLFVADATRPIMHCVHRAIWQPRRG